MKKLACLLALVICRLFPLCIICLLRLTEMNETLKQAQSLTAALQCRPQVFVIIDCFHFALCLSERRKDKTAGLGRKRERKRQRLLTSDSVGHSPNRTTDAATEHVDPWERGGRALSSPPHPTRVGVSVSWHLRPNHCSLCLQSACRIWNFIQTHWRSQSCLLETQIER